MPLQIHTFEKVYINAWGSFDKYFYNGGNVSECLHASLIESKEYDFDNPLRKQLEQHIGEGVKGVNDFYDLLFAVDLKINTSLIPNLNLFDIITPECFSSEHELGKAFIWLLSYSNLVLILHRRRILSETEINLKFEICHSDYEDQLANKLLRGEVE